MTPSQPNAVPVLNSDDAAGLLRSLNEWATMMYGQELSEIKEERVRCVPVMTEAEIRVEFEAWMKSFNSSARIQWNEQAVLVRYDGTSRSFDVTGKWEAYLAAFRHLRLVGGEG